MAGLRNSFEPVTKNEDAPVVSTVKCTVSTPPSTWHIIYTKTYVFFFFVCMRPEEITKNGYQFWGLRRKEVEKEQGGMYRTTYAPVSLQQFAVTRMINKTCTRWHCHQIWLQLKSQGRRLLVAYSFPSRQS